jgi:hypothetical protein
MAQVIECLPSKHKTLSSNPIITSPLKIISNLEMKKVKESM